MSAQGRKTIRPDLGPMHWPKPSDGSGLPMDSTGMGAEVGTGAAVAALLWWVLTGYVLCACGWRWPALSGGEASTGKKENERRHTGL